MGFDKPAVRSHFRTSHPQEPFLCDYCDRNFFDDEDYYQHAKTHVAYNAFETLEEVIDESEEELRNDIGNSATMCGNLLCPFGNYRSCGKWVDTLGVFVKAAGTLVNRRTRHLCWARNNGVLLLGGSSSPKGRFSISRK